MIKQADDYFRDCVTYCKSTQLQMELAINADVGYVLLRATYNLEGDGPLTLLTLNLSFLCSLSTSVHYPNIAAIYTKLSGGNQGLYISNCMTMLYHVQHQHILSVEVLLGSLITIECTTTKSLP